MENRRVITEGLLGLFFIILSTVLLLYEGFKENDTLAATEIEQRAISIETGAALFVSACAECHGLDGKGGIGAPFNDPHFFDPGPEGRLAEVGWGGSLEDFIIATVSGGRPVSTRPALYPGKGEGYAMPAWAEDFGGPFRPDQIRNLAHYILNWEAEATGEVGIERVYLVPPSDDPLFAGRLVFVNFGCVACHTIEGISTGPLGPDLTHVATNAATRVEGMTAEEYIRQSILDPAAFISPDCPTGPCADPTVMPLTFGDQLSDEQFENLLLFLLSLNGAAQEEG
jgi:mono/diheme cytochrome c family protein